MKLTFELPIDKTYWPDVRDEIEMGLVAQTITDAISREAPRVVGSAADLEINWVPVTEETYYERRQRHHDSLFTADTGASSQNVSLRRMHSMIRAYAPAWYGPVLQAHRREQARQEAASRPTPVFSIPFFNA